MSPYEQGRKAFRYNKSEASNPYMRYTTDFEEWEAGWIAEWYEYPTEEEK